ncbi:hypothetical protein ACFLT9_00970 [Acidobacteriota bacterium]
MINKIFVVLTIFTILLCTTGFAQKTSHFYDVDKEIKFTGTIQRILMESRYEEKAHFLILIVFDKKSGKTYTVEVSPVWFFSQDFHAGETLRLTGSSFTEGGVHHMIARQIQFKGKRLELRDKHGFPNWRGGQKKKQGIKKRKKF